MLHPISQSSLPGLAVAYVPTPEYYPFTDRMGREAETPEEAGDLFMHLRFPKIWEVGAIASIAECQVAGMFDAIRDESGKPILEAQKAMARVLFQLFNLNIIP